MAWVYSTAVLVVAPGTQARMPMVKRAKTRKLKPKRKILRRPTRDIRNQERTVPQNAMPVPPSPMAYEASELMPAERGQLV